MYDARGRTGGSSGLLFGGITIGVVAAAFFGVLLMPSGAAGTAPDTVSVAQGSDALLDVLDDLDTNDFVTALNRVAPESAKKLNQKAAAALARGADKDELADLVMASMDADLFANAQYLADADVKHFDAILQLSETGLTQLTGAGSKWCSGAHYEQFATASPDRIEDLIRDQFAYGTGGYRWGVQFNLVLLEAMADAKAHPRSYGAMTAQDQQALQGLAFQMMANPQVMQLMTLQGRGQAEMTRAMRGLDFCSLAQTGIDAVQSLPDGTRSRLWAEGLSQIKGGGLQDAMRQMGG